MCLSLIQNGLKGLNPNSTENYKITVLEFQERVKTLRFGYVPGVIRHHFHGSKKNRKYTERWQILVQNEYDPTTFVKYDDKQYGLLIPTEICPKKLLNEIFNYFKERNEDEEFTSNDFVYYKK